MTFVVIMKIKSFQGGFDKNLSHLIWCESNHVAAIVDASVNITEIMEYMGMHDLLLEKILITHSHSDHIHFLSDILMSFVVVNIILQSIRYLFVKWEKTKT